MLPCLLEHYTDYRRCHNVGSELLIVLSYHWVEGINPVFTAAARHEYVPVGSAPASLRVKAAAANTGFMLASYIVVSELSYWWVLLWSSAEIRWHVSRECLEGLRQHGC